MAIIRMRLLGLGFVGVLAVAAMPAFAQKISCDPVGEAISDMKPPTFGYPAIWEAVYGDKNHMVQLAGGVPLSATAVMLLAGKVDAKTSAPAGMGVVELNNRGRALVEIFNPSKDSDQPVAFAKAGDGFAGVANIRAGKKRDRHVRISWYDRDGKFRRAQTLSDPVYDYEAQKIVTAIDGKGVVVVIHAVGRKDKADQYGVLARYNADGKLGWKRSYRPGVSNKLNGLNVTDDNGYIATGRIIMNDGRMAGWALKLGADGAVLWQRTYPRGKFSELNAAAIAPHKSPDGASLYSFTGAAEPAGGGVLAGWVMETDPYGMPRWQHYMRRKDYTFQGFDIKPQNDGTVMVALNATAQGTGDAYRDHVRFVTLSARGSMLGDQAYMSGLKTHAVQVEKNGAGNFVLVASSLQPQKTAEEEFGPAKPLPEGKQPEDPAPLEAGWVAIIPPPDAYVDPCIVPKK